MIKLNILKSRKARFLAISLIIVILLGASYVIYMEEQGNFHCITQGHAYRSGQLDRDELEYYISKYNIKSVLNLRGEDPDEPWYIEETKVCRMYNVAHYNLALSAGREPSENKVEQLLDVFNNTPCPVLIHCKAGADRSGLASAMWKVVIDGQSKEQAKKQLSILYGHIPFGRTAVLDDFFEKWCSRQIRTPERIFSPQPTKK